MFPAHHHRTGWVNGDNLGAFFHERQQKLNVRPRVSPKRLQITMLPCRHATALQSTHTANIHTVPLQDFDRIASDLRLVVLYVTGLEKNHFTANLRLDLSAGCGPLLECRRGKIGQQLVAMDAESFFQKYSI